jgi:NADH-quinone oxidoreductase subunit L
MACVVNGIGLLVAIFSTEYMKGNPSITRYWFLIQLFIGGLVLTVVSDNLLWLFIGWEIVGLSCSLLVAFWHNNPYNAHNGFKTFMVLHVGDILLLFGILMIFVYSGTFSFIELQQDKNWILQLSKSGFLLLTAMMLFGGAIAKSALFPLHVWLPDALPASPASFNALTEVLAGAFLISRFLLMFHDALVDGYSELLFFFLAIAWIGAVTALLGASMAMVQKNIIRVLVYSIISQYAYVMVGLGTAGLMMSPASGYLAANMHLMVDAVSSALLFFSAASLLYTTGSQDMLEIGMAKVKMPITFKCMVVGTLALMGIPPLSGFWTEEAIGGTVLELIREANEHGQHSLLISGLGIYVLLVITTGITAFYTVRMMGLIFTKHKGTSEKKVVEEVPIAMRIPMIIASVITVGIGLLAPFIIFGFRGFFSSVLYGLETNGGIVDVVREALLSPGTVVTSLALFVGILPAYNMYVSRRIDQVKMIEKNWFLSKVHKILWNRYYINTFYYKVAFSLVSISQAIYLFVELRCLEKFNHKIVEGIIWLSDKILKTQTGILSYNMLGFLLGMLLIILLFFFSGFF